VRSSDRWVLDPRIDEAAQSGEALYKSNDLDRGHLVRRLDPVWGPDAADANVDTFHFTNSAPQHLKLNRRTWVDLEDYVLQSASAHELKVCVFTGPVFRADDMLYRGEYRIPAEFWKVVVMVRTDGQLSATAYLQTQKNLIESLEFAYGEYRTYQVPVAQVEGITQLDFGRLRDHDPLAGIESAGGRVIGGAGDLKL
jgi:endonuclease G, mitochondrial